MTKRKYLFNIGDRVKKSSRVAPGEVLERMNVGGDLGHRYRIRWGNGDIAWYGEHELRSYMAVNAPPQEGDIWEVSSKTTDDPFRVRLLSRHTDKDKWRTEVVDALDNPRVSEGERINVSGDRLMRCIKPRGAEPTFEPGDIVVGRYDGDEYRVESVYGNYMTLVRSKDGRILTNRMIDAFKPLNKPTATFDYSVAATITTNNTNNTKENTNMNTNHITNAITNLRQADANAAVEPVYREVVKLLDKVKPGRGVVQYWNEGDRNQMQFWFRDSVNQWSYGNGDRWLPTDDVIEILVKRQVQYDGRIVRLVKAK